MRSIGDLLPHPFPRQLPGGRSEAAVGPRKLISVNGTNLRRLAPHCDDSSTSFLHSCFPRSTLHSRRMFYVTVVVLQQGSVDIKRLPVRVSQYCLLRGLYGLGSFAARPRASGHPLAVLKTNARETLH